MSKTAIQQIQQFLPDDRKPLLAIPAVENKRPKPAAGDAAIVLYLCLLHGAYLSSLLVSSAVVYP